MKNSKRTFKLILVFIITFFVLLLIAVPVHSQAVNDINIRFSTICSYRASGNSFTNMEVSGPASWSANFSNTIDSTNEGVKNLSLVLNSNEIFSSINPIPNSYGPPTYQWSFGDFAQNNLPDSSPQLSVQLVKSSNQATFTPGFDVYWSADTTRFSAPGTQTITITLIPKETQDDSIQINTSRQTNVQAIINPPQLSKTGIVSLSADGSTLNILNLMQQAGETLTYTITVQVTPNASIVEFMPDITIASHEKISENVVIGNSISQTMADVGTFSWSADGSYQITTLVASDPAVVFPGHSWVIEPSTTTIVTSPSTTTAAASAPSTTTISAPPPTENSIQGLVSSPQNVPKDAKTIATDSILAIVTVLIFYFSATLFNSTIKENYKTFQNWSSKISERFTFLHISSTSLPDRLYLNKTKLRLYLEGFLVVGICTLIYWFLDPYFAEAWKGIILFISLAIGIIVATYGYDGIQVLISRRLFRVPSIIGMYPLAIPIAVICVLVSRSINFHPGLIYGFVGSYIALTLPNDLTDKRDEKRNAMLVLSGTGVVFIICVLAFFARSPLQNHAVGSWENIADSILAATIAIGLEGLVFLFVPLTFLDGHKVIKWNFWIWLSTALLLTFLFWWIIIVQNHDLKLAAIQMGAVSMYILMGLSLAISLGIWSFFKVRNRHPAIEAPSSPSIGLVLTPSTVTAGLVVDFTVTVRDASGKTITNYLGTVHFTSTDSQAVLPGDYTFGRADKGTRTFSCALKTAGSQSITATDTITSTITGTQSGIIVNPGALDHFTITGYPSTVIAGANFGSNNMVVTAYDAHGNIKTDYTGSIKFNSSDAQAALPSQYNFTTGSDNDNGIHTFNGTDFTLKTSPSQTIIVNDRDKNIKAGVCTITVNPATASKLIVTGYPSPVAASTNALFSVIAVDNYGNIATDYTGKVTFSSSDDKAILPVNSTLINGTGKFSVTLKTAGIQSITVTDIMTGTITGIQVGITVNPADTIQH
jgi:hypothetical protein